MAEWIIVNGARIEKSYFDANVTEARSKTWTPARWDKTSDHGHCLVCGVTISLDKPDYFRSGSTSLCSYCFRNYVATQNGLK
jgi:hypothetical protein